MTSVPIRPPILLAELLTPCAALLTPDPADEVTLDRPSEALDVAADAVSFPFAAVLEAASEVVEAWRRADRRATTRLCRSINREGADDIALTDGAERGVKGCEISEVMSLL